MTLIRVIPCLLLSGKGLVKTVRFRERKYVGDPRNVVKIFNEKEIHELVILDIDATLRNAPPQFDLISEIVSEAFVPVAYGGGIQTVDRARQILQLGVEKVIINSAAAERPALVSEAAHEFGSQSVVISMDAGRLLFGRYEVCTRGGRRKTGYSPPEYARLMEQQGAGEILINSIDRDGTQAGYDLDLLRQTTAAVRIPVIACGGAGRLDDLATAVHEGGASAVAAGSLFVFHGKHRAVLVSYPSPETLWHLFKVEPSDHL